MWDGDETQYEIKEKIGEGAFGEVCLATDKKTNAHVAIKYIRLTTRKGQLPKAVFREMESLRQLNDCKHVVSLLDTFVTDSSLCLVLEYLSIDLSSIISKLRIHLSQPQTKYLFHSIFMALDHIHRASIIHRDIKPSNIMLDANGILKLNDFGLARICTSHAINPAGRQMSHQVATRWYRPPELLFASRTYSFSMDVWSAGAVLGEVLYLNPLFPGMNDIDQMFRVFQILGTPSQSNWPGVKLLPDWDKVRFPAMDPVDLRLMMPHADLTEIAMLEAVLRLDPDKRPTAAQICREPYFYEYPLPSSSFEMKMLVQELGASL